MDAVVAALSQKRNGVKFPKDLISEVAPMLVEMGAENQDDVYAFSPSVMVSVVDECYSEGAPERVDKLIEQWAESAPGLPPAQLPTVESLMSQAAAAARVGARGLPRKGSRRNRRERPPARTPRTRRSNPRRSW